jgi:pantetheine-phosphate adenylyltransferase
MRKAVYAGSFDPLTKGHMDIIERGSKLFDELIIAIGINPDKKSMFTLDERVEMIYNSTKNLKNLKIESFENKFLVKYAESIDANYILRGIRTQLDYEYERGIKHINSDLNKKIDTIFLMPPREISEVSSSLVKGLVGSEGWEDIIENYIPSEVYNKFLIKFNGLESRWIDLCNNTKAKKDNKEAYNKLLSLYGEPHRRYHNFVHIAHSLKELDEVKSLLKNPEQLEFSIWYHDAIYNTKEKDNEEKSAELAKIELNKIGLKQKFIRGVENLILKTKHQTIPKEPLEKYIIDIDLSILGKQQDVFDEYERNIRMEYSQYPEEMFRKGRKGVLEGFLKREPIYSTDIFRQKYEEQAKRNLKRSLNQLKDQRIS